MKNTIIIEFDLIMLYKIYYKTNIELIYLFITKIKCQIFLQVDILIKKCQFFFGNFPSRSRSGQDKFGTGRDTGRKPRPEPFSGRDKGQGCPDPVPSHEHPPLGP